MADWGPDIFDNDDAMDWIYDLLDSGGISRVKRALDIVEEEGAEDVDMADCRIALAAADLVAALDGDINPNLPTEAEEWLTLINRPVSNLRVKAEEVVRDILQSSPLKVYYKNNGKFPEWKQMVESLLKRLEL